MFQNFLLTASKISVVLGSLLSERELGSIWLRVTMPLSSGFEGGTIRDEAGAAAAAAAHLSILGLDSKFGTILGPGGYGEVWSKTIL